MELRTKRVIPVLTFIFGSVWAYVGLTEYNWMIDGTPGKGFFPAIIGLLMMFVSVVIFFLDYNHEKVTYSIKHVYPILMVVLIIGASYIVGLILALGLYMFLWLYAYEKYSLKFSGAFSIIGTMFIYGVFSYWLNIPFPTGMLPL